MKFVRTVTLFTLLAVATCAVALEQEGGVRLILGEPTGDFGRAVDGLGFGASAHYGLRPQPSLTFGAGADVIIYGSETRKISLPLVEDFDLTTENYLAGGFVFAQLRPFSGVLQPYAEARIGFNYLWTESKLEDEDWWDDDEVARQTNYDDFATFWSGGGGLLIRLTEGDRTEGSPGAFLDFKVTHQRGGEAEYLTEGDIAIENNEPIFSPSRSETDMTTFELGVVFTF